MAQGPGPLLYKPAPKWQVFAAFGGALFLHLAAVALAYKHEPPPADVSPDLPNTVEAVIETQPPEDLPTPPPEDIPLPPPPPEVPQVQEFHEENTPPPKQQRTPAKQAPIKAPQQTGPPHPATMGASAGKAAAIFAPKPEYPYEARRSKITGSGVCVVTVDPASGSVTDASMAQSTGNAILDNATVSSFRRWRFKPGVVSKVRIPITYTMNGASY